MLARYLLGRSGICAQTKAESLASTAEEQIYQASTFFGLETPKTDLQALTEHNMSAAVVPLSWQKPFEILKACHSQWCWRDEYLQGLNYQGIEAFLRLSAQQLTPQEFLILQRLEIACCDYWNTPPRDHVSPIAIAMPPNSA